MMEEWRSVIGYEGLYEISNKGNVRSLDRLTNGVNGVRFLKGNNKVVGYSPNGYARVMLCKNGTKKTLSLHRLVANAFIENPSCKPCVNHIDGDKGNNWLSNLEWCTHSENTRHSFDVLGRGYDDTFCSMYGAESSRSKKVVAYTIDGLLLGVFGCILDAAKNTSTNRVSISMAINGKRSCVANGIVWRELSRKKHSNK